MRRVVLLLSALALLPVSDALAKAPRAAEKPTLETIYREAKTAYAAELKRAAEEKRDPVGEAIRDYRDKMVPVTSYAEIVRVILDEADESVQPYRRRAVESLIERFREGMQDPVKRKVRREVALELLKLMKRHPNKDLLGLHLIEELLYTWWRPKMYEYRFKASDRIKSRQKAYSRMKRYLEKEER